MVAQVGLEIWDKTSGADSIVGSTGSQSGDKTISVASGDNLLLKQPKDTVLDANARVDIYRGWYGQPSIYVNTVFANSAGYWEYAITANTNDCRRYFVYINNITYSNGISVQIGSATCGETTIDNWGCNSSGKCVQGIGGTLPSGCKSQCCKDPIGLGCIGGIPNTYILGIAILFFMMNTKK